MQAYRGIHLERSCISCIKSKRRCDRQVPKCSRCTQRNQKCSYINEPLTAHAPEEEAGGDSVQPHIPGRVFSPVNRGHIPSHPDELPIEDRLRFDRRVSMLQALHLWKQQATVKPLESPEELHQRKLELYRKAREWKSLIGVEPSMKMVRLKHSERTHNYLIQTLSFYPELFCSTGKTPFIHPLLSDMRRDSPAKDVFDACVAYQLFPHGALNNLRSNVDTLLQSQPLEGAFEQLLSAIQALLLVAMALLFSPNESIRDIMDGEAEKLLRTLSLWTKQLYTSVPQHLPSSLTPWQAWTYAESVRRAIIFSHMIIDVFAMLRTGVFFHSVFLDALPFDSRTQLWESEEDPGPGGVAGAPMISYKEFTDVWRAGLYTLEGDERSWETLLMVACCGAEKVSKGYDFELHRRYPAQDA